DGSQIGTVLFQVRYGRQRMDYYIPDEGLGPELIALSQMFSTFEFIEEDETSDWETYTNEEYGYEINYPKEYNLRILEHRNSPCFIDMNPPEGVCAFSIIAYSLDELTLEEWVKQTFFLPGKPEELLITHWEKIGQNNWLFLHDLEGPGPGTYHRFIGNNETVVDVGNSLKTFNVIETLSTFKFLD
ncbi:hypothetical protein ACFL06_02065, partial [Patescibacteria group bacterium]